MMSLTTKAVGELSGATSSYFHSSPGAPVEAAATGMGFTADLTGDSNYVFSAFWFRGPEEPAGPAPADQPLLQVGDAGGCHFFGEPPPAFPRRHNPAPEGMVWIRGVDFEPVLAPAAEIDRHRAALEELRRALDR